MSQRLKVWVLLGLVAAVSLTAGYSLQRPRRPKDVLDAVAAVQRHSPRFLVSEPPLPAGAYWVPTGPAIYLCDIRKTPEEVDGLIKLPSRPGPRWAGVVCFRGLPLDGPFYIPWISDDPGSCLDYGSFGVYGDPEILRLVQAVLAAEGFRRGHRLLPGS